MDFSKNFFYHAQIAPERPAIISTLGVATYELLAQAVRIASERLRLEGLPRGGLVAIDVRHPLHHAALILALATRGIPSVSVQTTFSIQLAGLPVTTLLVDRYAQPAPSLRSLLVDDAWFDGRDPGPDFEHVGFATQNDIVRVVLSSGTTGVPKSIALTGELLERRISRRPLVIGGFYDGPMMSIMGLSTMGGFSVLVTALSTGAASCHSAGIEEALHIIRIFGVTRIVASPIQLHQMVQQARGRACPSLRHVTLGGSRISQSLLTEALAGLTNNIMVAYGSTEAGIVSSVRAMAVPNVDGVAGYIVPWVTVEIADDSGNPLPRGREGIIRVRSDELASYFVTQADDGEIVRDGWFYPGDIGTIRSDGLLIVLGRSAEIINRGGSKVAPEMVEQVLAQRPEIAEAAVFGVMNDAGMEEIWAAIIPRQPLDQAAILTFCRQKLADKAPDRIVEITEIPRNDMGKVLRNQLRQSVAKRRN